MLGNSSLKEYKMSGKEHMKYLLTRLFSQKIVPKFICQTARTSKAKKTLITKQKNHLSYLIEESRMSNWLNKEETLMSKKLRKKTQIKRKRNLEKGTRKPQLRSNQEAMAMDKETIQFPRRKRRKSNLTPRE